MATVETAARHYTERDWQDIYHTGPGTLAGRYLRLFWQPVLRSQDLPAGKAKPIRVMSQDFTLYRGESGAAHLVDLRCAHRRTQLSIGWVEGDNIRCRYHGWAYDAAGQCVDQPGEPNPFCERVRIGSYPTREYLGLIFAYLGEGEAPPFPTYPAAEDEGVRECHTYVRLCNFFNSLDNDPVHVPFTHRQPGVHWSQKPIPVVSAAEETDFGARTFDAKRPGGRQGWRGMPNVSYRPYANEVDEPLCTTHLAWRVPIDDHSHRAFLVDVTHVTGEEAEHYLREQAALQTTAYEETTQVIQQVLDGELHLDDVDLPAISRTNVEDGATQVGQGTIPDHENEHLGSADAGVVIIRKLWMRELRALAEGRPIRRWVVPPLSAAQELRRVSPPVLH